MRKGVKAERGEWQLVGLVRGEMDKTDRWVRDWIQGLDGGWG
jgi:hypothetical protein